MDPTSSGIMYDSPDPSSTLQTPEDHPDLDSSLTLETNDLETWNDPFENIGLGFGLTQGTSSKMGRKYGEPEIEKDYRVVIEESAVVISRFLSRLRQLDEESTVDDPVRESFTAETRVRGDLIGGSKDIEKKIQDYLEKVEGCIKVREGQVEALNVLVRANGLRALTAEANPETSFGEYEGFEPLGKGDITDEEVDDVADDGGPEDGTDERRITSPTAWLGVDSENSLADLASPRLHLPQQKSKQSKLPVLNSLRLLETDTQNAINTLSSLSETIHQSSSLNISINRTLRGIRAGIENWKQRDKEEEEARIGIERWERKGLGDALNNGTDGRKGVKERLEEEIRGFEMVVDDWGRRMGEMVNMAIVA